MNPVRQQLIDTATEGATGLRMSELGHAAHSEWRRMFAAGLDAALPLIADHIDAAEPPDDMTPDEVVVWNRAGAHDAALVRSLGSSE